MRRWKDHISRHVGSSANSFSSTFFGWLCRQLIMIIDYLYMGMDLCDDPEIMIPKGERWGVIGNIFQPFEILKFCEKKLVFMFLRLNY